LQQALDFSLIIPLYYLRGVLMEENFNKHLGSKLKLRRLALGLTQTKVAKAINVTFQQIQKYEKGTNGVSSIRLLQLSNYLKVPISYFFEDFPAYLINIEKSKEGHMNVNYNFLMKLYSELSSEQKIKFNKAIEVSANSFSRAV
jgi:transcriptional regulator with XRE-family HTH domain